MKKPNESFEKWLLTPEYEVMEKANEMLAVFLVKGAPEPRIRNWRSHYRDELLKLIIKCEENNLYPLPDCVVELARQLLGKTRGGVQPSPKYLVLEKIAEKYDPPAEGQALQQGIISYAAKVLEDAGGLRRTTFTQAGKPDYRQSVRPWFKEEAFIKEWRLKRARNKNREEDPQFQELLEVVKRTSKKK
tara:strand:+ start:3755 stop:4321 length:567 start_codon:yes stop_codon:yes gene_type:complete